ncbi:MAG: sugar phosphate isomerase/epimerase [Clostridia bacterium]|nr:sugar phosphate isomerase/epimerase [Clostridia bacterium]
MLLGGTVAGAYGNPAEWEELLVRTGFRAVTAPFDCRTPKDDVRAYLEIAKKHGVCIAEVGVWRNLMDPDPEAAARNLAYAKDQLRLADETGVPCCVNIVGTAGTGGWDAADRSNFTPGTYERIIAGIREILDEVEPRRAFYCIEPMPWMVPDSPEAYLQLIRDVDRPQFGAHMDFVNMINCPRRYLAPEDFIETCFRLLAPYIKSTHIKDTRMHPTRLTAILEECSPGEGTLDYERVLRIMDRYLPPDAPVLLEHMQTAEEYDQAYRYVKAAADRIGIPV